MRTKWVSITIALLLVAVFIFQVYKKNQSVLTNIRVGWQIPWATEGQLVQVLKHKEFLKNEKLNAEFTGFASGAPLNEAALSGKVDVIFTADQPAATLLSKNPDWVIIGRLMYNRVSLYVAPNSPIKSGSDLKGKTVAMPFGAAAQRLAYKIQKDAGLDPAKDVNNINLDIYEQASLITDKNASKWGKIDAVAGFDPTPAVFEEKGLTKNIAVGKVVSVIMMPKSYIDANPEAPTQFLRAFRESYKYYRDNVAEVDQWYKDESKLNVSSKALEISAGLEPNLKKDEQINIGFTDEDYAILQEAADFIYSTKLISKQVDMKDHINLNYLKEIDN